MKRNCYSEIANLNLAEREMTWLLQPANKARVKDICALLGPYLPDDDFILSTKISIESARNGFFDSWNESILDRILEEMLPAIKPYHALYKDFLQFNIANLCEGKRKINFFSIFIEANVENLGREPEDWSLLPSPADELIYNLDDGNTYQLVKDWPKPAFRKVVLATPTDPSMAPIRIRSA